MVRRHVPSSLSQHFHAMEAPGDKSEDEKGRASHRHDLGCFGDFNNPTDYITIFNEWGPELHRSYIAHCP